MASSPSSNAAASPAARASLDVSSPASPEGRDSPDLPLTMSASTVLMSLPRDATAALAAAGAFPQEKVVLRFKPVGSAPPLPVRRELARVVSTYKFEFVVTHLRKILKVQDTESVFLYINSTFAPALDEVVGNLWRCFKDSNNQLNVAYSITPAFG
ncbi:ubiquitin-like autophagy protein Apg12-domain-containing protein [Lasiosphaeria hispida]|uniref:Ubiquitin-like protein ATG12 n=1 Tax=Lasiosphaeria hispida TaxID=260671 RepID=A0AAJ0MCW2_9PEZI|nr:ubiquitin-like autophagy protein Apg12-domain-containing protein [Lasiosphaeria hispida]